MSKELSKEPPPEEEGRILDVEDRDSEASDGNTSAQQTASEGSPESPVDRTRGSGDRAPTQDRYCILIKGQEDRGVSRQSPTPEIWTGTMLMMGLAPFAGPTLTEVVPISRDHAVLFFGRRSLNEGLGEDASLTMMRRLPPPSNLVQYRCGPGV